MGGEGTSKVRYPYDRQRGGLAMLKWEGVSGTTKLKLC